jgi:formylglycine-generating enzyme required for sulfatase activity
MDVAANGPTGTVAYNAGGYATYSVADDVIKIRTSGLNNTRPAILACDFNNNNVYGENGDGQSMAVSVLSKGDILAYLDWSGLRPMTEMEYEKACRGTLNRVIGEYGWGNTAMSFFYKSSLSNRGFAEESYTGTVLNGQVMGGAFYAGGEVNKGPSRSGVFASGSSGRASSGAGYYGAMELSGNALELAVQVDAKGVLFTNKNGNGQLTASGDSDVQSWPLPNDNANPSGMHWRGGDFYSYTLSYFTTSYRAYGVAGTVRNFVFGGRGIRTAP